MLGWLPVVLYCLNRATENKTKAINTNTCLLSEARQYFRGRLKGMAEDLLDQ